MTTTHDAHYPTSVSVDPSVRFLTFTFFFFNDTATTEIYTLSLHDALPISVRRRRRGAPLRPPVRHAERLARPVRLQQDRKSTRLNSSHSQISYAVFCLKKKKKSNYLTHCTD